MKKILLLGWLVLLFSACQKHEDEVAPEDLPDARLEKVLTEYKARLTEAEYGWKAMLYPKNGQVYSFLMKFTPTDRVTMTGDINPTTGIPLESSYRLKAMQQPSLLFDTYSHLHILADPDPEKSNGDVGEGKYSDFEFYFESVTAETITLKGQRHGSRLVLTKATQAQATSYNTNIAAYVGAIAHLNSFTTYFKRLTIGTKMYDIQVNSTERIISFIYFAGEMASSFTSSFYYSDEGLVLLEPFTHEGTTISVLKGLQVNNANRQLNLTINNEVATIQEAARPVKVDVQGARNFLNSATGEDYWVGLTGFTINGVVDSLKLLEIPDFYFLVLWPKSGVSNSVNYDLLGFVKPNATGDALEIAYGPTAVSRVTSDGRLIYTFLELMGTVPPQEEPAVTASQQLWTDPQGFFVMTYGNNIDLVSAKDGKTWLSTFLP
jgi:hypothetical protein